MNWFDMRTIILSFTLSNFICMCVIGILWYRNRSRFQGLGFWLADFIMQFIALLLITLRGSIPDLISMTGSNSLVILGTLLLLIGFEYFIDQRWPRLQNYLLLIVFIFIHAYFVLVKPSLMMRGILFSVMQLTLCAQCAWLMLKRRPAAKAELTRGVGLVFLSYSLLAVGRLMVELFLPSGKDFFRANFYESLVFLIYQMLFVILTFSLSLMVNRRLFSDLEKDISARKEAESALRLSEEKFSKAFEASPDAVLISSLSDGRFLEVNESFCLLIGYTREELLSTTSLQIRLWETPREREMLVADLRERQAVRDYETRLRKKNGAFLTVSYSAEMMRVEGEALLISVIRDITERKQSEEILKLRLMLWEYSADHSGLEVMQKALDEIEVLTESRISFYHLVDEDQGGISLQAWSTRTKEEFCKAEGSGTHYSVEKAGVWADCIRERKPLIHNDYPGLPHKKGLPEGHAAVNRELAVPILRANKIVSVLGVGNKPDDYTETDVKMVTYIADLVWTIVEQKQANEQIRKLNVQLEYLSMTDELTGLPNRRDFFLLAAEEFRKAKRYRLPMCLIMLDIDHFKNINDTYGHDAGDSILRCFAETLRKNGRDSDLVARIGGEEFVILLPNTKLHDAMTFAERLRASIEREGCIFEKQCVPITASLGVAAFGEGMETLDLLLKEADNAMYRAKKEGRNRVAAMN